MANVISVASFAREEPSGKISWGVRSTAYWSGRQWAVSGIADTFADAWRAVDAAVAAHKHTHWVWVRY